MTVDTFWWHSFDINGQVTPGRKSEALLEAEWAAMRMPDLTGKTVLDIGCWDGWFSFKAEREGAERVVAMDYYVWSIDLPRWHAEDGNYEQASFYGREDLWDPVNLPGKRGFDLAHAALGSNVEARVDHFLLADIEPFDVVIFSGVLYHLEDPFRGLRRVRQLTNELAVIETESHEFNENRPLWEFIADDRLANDSSNWWVPNEFGLVDMCHAAGFETVTPLPRLEPHRLIVHAS